VVLDSAAYDAATDDHHIGRARQWIIRRHLSRT
jgi:hypothetical protein